MTRTGIILGLYAEHVEPQPFTRFTADTAEQAANKAWRERADDWGFFHVDSHGNWDGSTKPVTHAADCIGLHTSCTVCGTDDLLNICVNDFGAPEHCPAHSEVIS